MDFTEARSSSMSVEQDTHANAKNQSSKYVADANIERVGSRLTDSRIWAEFDKRAMGQQRRYQGSIVKDNALELSRRSRNKQDNRAML